MCNNLVELERQFGFRQGVDKLPEKNIMEILMKHYIVMVIENYVLDYKKPYERGITAGKGQMLRTIFKSLGTDVDGSPEFIDAVQDLYKSLDKLLAIALQKAGGD